MSISILEIKETLREHADMLPDDADTDAMAERLTGAQLRHIARRVRERTEQGHIRDVLDRQIEIVIQVSTALNTEGVT